MSYFIKIYVARRVARCINLSQIISPVIWGKNIRGI